MVHDERKGTAGKRLFSSMESFISRSMDMQHLFVLGMLLILYVISTLNYLVFHSLIEIITVVIASCIFIITWNARKYLENNFFVIVGIAFLFVSIINVTHLLAYKGMNVFPEYGANLATQLWIAGRYLEAFSLLAASVTMYKKIDYRAIFGAYTVATALLLASIFYFKVFPVCFVDGSGLTPFKVYSEYAIALIIFASLALLVARRRQFEPRVFRMLAAAFVLTIVSGLTFTLYSNVYDIYNFLGHALRLVAFYLIYLAIVQTGLRTPYDLIFRNLKKSEADLSDANDRLKKDIVELNRTEEALTESKKQAELYVDLMGHDINNMNHIGIASLELALEDEHLDEDTRMLIKQSLASFKGSSNLIGNVKKLQQVKEQRLEQGMIDIGSVLAAVVRQYRDVDRNAKISYDDATGYFVKGNELLHDVFANLIGNAIKHAENPVNVRVDVGRADEGGKSFCRVAVEDDGSGIPDDRKTEIFNRFTRGNTRAKGSGLGLYLIRTIVESHGGKVWVEDRVAGDYRQGSRFVVMLPAASTSQ